MAWTRSRSVPARVRRWVALWSALAFATAALTGVVVASRAGASGPTPPIGNQKVLVLPIEFPSCSGNGCFPTKGSSPYCPNASLDCPTDRIKFGPPRHSPAQWENILNQQASVFWSDSSYNQTNFTFTVVADPNTSDGWFPAPHALQLYNRGGWGVDPKDSPPYVPYSSDVASSALDTLCSIPIVALSLNCGKAANQFPHNYDRLVIMNNWQDFGGQTYGNNVTYDINTAKTGKLSITTSAVNEDSVDGEAVQVVEHELGHQLGSLAHYGDCKYYPPPYIAGTNFNEVNCLGKWDIMSYTDGSASLLSGYSRDRLGMLNAAGVVSHNLVGEGAFTDLQFMRPLELQGTASNPNLVRLSLVPLDWPGQLGYDVECRERIGGDQGDANVPTAGIPDEGLVVTSVHEFSYDDLWHPAPAHHVERKITKFVDPIDKAMHAGQVFTDNVLGLQIRFDGFVNDSSIAPARLCQVSIANLTSLPNPINYIALVTNRVLTGATESGSSAPAPDLGLNLPLPPIVDATGAPGPNPVDPLWPGHDNLAFVRVHNRGLSTAGNVKVRAKIASPATVTELCGNNFSGPTQTLSVPAAGDGVASFDYRAPATAGSSFSIYGESTGPNGSESGATEAAFQFFPPGTTTQASTFKITLDKRCSGPRTFFVQPVQLAGPFTEKLSVHAVTLAPGASKTLKVTVQAPAGVGPGLASDVPVLVLEQRPDDPVDPRVTASQCTNVLFFACGGSHVRVVDTLNVFAQVVSGSTSVFLDCPPAGHVGQAIGVGGTESAANSAVLVEVTAPDGTTSSQLATVNGNGFSAGFTPSAAGAYTLVAHSSGNTSVAPGDSPPCTINVT